MKLALIITTTALLVSGPVAAQQTQNNAAPVYGGPALPLGPNGAAPYSDPRITGGGYIVADTTGTTDVTAVLRAAIGTQPGLFRLPPGQYKVSGTISLASGQVLECAGNGATLIQAVPAVGKVVVDYPVIAMGMYGGPPIVSNNSGVTRCLIDGGATTTGVRLSGSIYVGPNSYNNKIINNEVRNAGDNGIETQGIATEIAQNYVHDNYTNGVYADGYYAASITATYRTSRVWIHNNRVSNNSKTNRDANNNWLGGSPSWDGIDVDPISEYATVESNDVEYNDIILYETGANVSSSYGHRVINNVVYQSPQNCMNISGYVNQSQLVGNRCYLPIGYGALLNTVGFQNRVSDNFFQAPTSGGITLNNGSGYTGTASIWDFDNNQILNASSSLNFGSGIAIAAGAFDIKIRGGWIKDTRGTLLMKYAIDTSAAGANVVVQNVNMSAGATGTVNAKAADAYRNNPGLNPAGVLTPPAVPASTVGLANPFPYDAQVCITPASGGAVSVISVNGAVTGITLAAAGSAQCVTIDQGRSIAITYAAAPTWVWYGK